MKVPNFGAKLLRTFFQRLATQADELLCQPITACYDRVMLFTDASLLGWGAHCEGTEFGGLWTEEESLEHITTLEMRAVRLVL